jgi:hypothetical protein
VVLGSGSVIIEKVGSAMLWLVFANVKTVAV